MTDGYYPLDIFTQVIDLHFGGGGYIRIDFISQGFHNHGGAALFKWGDNTNFAPSLTILKGGDDASPPNGTQPPGYVDVQEQLDVWGNLVTPPVTAAQLKQKFDWGDGTTIDGFGFWNNHLSAELPWVGTATFLKFPGAQALIQTECLNNASRSYVGMSYYKPGVIGVGTQFHSWGVDGGLPTIPQYDNNKTMMDPVVTSGDHFCGFSLSASGKVGIRFDKTNGTMVPGYLESPHIFGNT